MKRTVWLAALALTVLFLTAGCGTLMEESVVRGGVEALEEVCGLLDAYLPEETLDWFRFSVSLRTSCGKTFTTDVTRRGEADFAYESDLLRLNFAAGPSVLEEDGGSENGIKNVIIVLSF